MYGQLIEHEARRQRSLPCVRGFAAVTSERAELAADPEYAATVEAVREALADMANGDTGKPLDQFVREFRQRYNLPAGP